MCFISDLLFAVDKKITVDSGEGFLFEWVSHHVIVDRFAFYAYDAGAEVCVMIEILSDKEPYLCFFGEYFKLLGTYFCFVKEQKNGKWDESLEKAKEKLRQVVKEFKKNKIEDEMNKEKSKV